MERNKQASQGEQPTLPTDEQTALEVETRTKWESLRPSFNAWATQSGEPLSLFDEIVDGQVEYTRVVYQKRRASTELAEYSVPWDRVTIEEATSLEELLNTNADESALHRFLDANPKFLIQVLGGGHGRYHLSKQRLGAEFVPDFLVAEVSSIGFEWYAVEIESPGAVAHRQDELPAEPLNHALGQIRDWRRWLMNNLNYARRPRDQDGLGLVGIDSRVPGLILIGRRHAFPERFNDFRKQMIDRERIVIHSYDWLIDIAHSNRSGRLGSELPE